MSSIREWHAGQSVEGVAAHGTWHVVATAHAAACAELRLAGAKKATNGEPVSLRCTHNGRGKPPSEFVALCNAIKGDGEACRGVSIHGHMLVHPLDGRKPLDTLSGLACKACQRAARDVSAAAAGRQRNAELSRKPCKKYPWGLWRDGFVDYSGANDTLERAAVDALLGKRAREADDRADANSDSSSCSGNSEDEDDSDSESEGSDSESEGSDGESDSESDSAESVSAAGSPAAAAARAAYTTTASALPLLGVRNWVDEWMARWIPRLLPQYRTAAPPDVPAAKRRRIEPAAGVPTAAPRRIGLKHVSPLAAGQPPSSARGE
jgi:hypothetical protein